MSRIYVGTSGWHYDHWVGPFYPEATPPEKRLAFYARKFDAVEINNTFYQLPSEATLAGWCRDTPRRFLFACKASRYITHMKKLKEPAESLRRFLRAVETLEHKLGPVLFQLPPRWHVDLARLRSFLEALPPNHRYAFEFRDPTWHRREVYRELSRHEAALCIFELAGERSPVEVTADFVYVRLHGPGGPYQGSYDGRSLFGWARRLRRFEHEGLDVYCFFDNDERGFAPRNAGQLRKMIERESQVENRAVHAFLRARSKHG